MNPTIHTGRVFAFGALLLALIHPAAAEWTLERSVQRALAVSPELDAGAARLEARRAAARQAGAWPNPTLSVTTDNAAAPDKRSRQAFSEAAFTQPLPMGLQASRQAAAESLAAVESQHIQALRLELERRAAEAFHRLQWAQAALDLARNAARQAESFAAAGERRAALGDISHRERLRLSVLAAEAEQAIEEAEGEWLEALYDFATLLDVPPEHVGRLPELEAPTDVPPLGDWTALAERHPTLERHRADLAAVGAEQAVARKERLPRIGVMVFDKREYLEGSRESITGLGLSVELPLWDRRSGRLDELAALQGEGRARLHGARRLLMNQVQVQYRHLGHLTAQAQHHARAVLGPAREILSLTQRGYEDGELDLLALIEAVQTVRQAEARHRRLLADAWLELAALRASAGLFLVEDYRQ